jgi:hypothetical protein
MRAAKIGERQLVRPDLNGGGAELCRRLEIRKRTGEFEARLCKAGRREPPRQIIHGPARTEDAGPRPHDQALPQAWAAADHRSDDASTPTQAAGDLADGGLGMRHAVKAPVGEEEIDAAVCKRDALCVALDELDLVESERACALACSLQHER